MFKKTLCLFLLVCFYSPVLQAQDMDERAKLTAGIPVYVGHDKERPGVNDWNEGWFNNEGVFIDVSWPFLKMGDRTVLRFGGTLGAFYNSLYKTSVFFGGVAEIETFVSPEWAFQFGTYAGAITGYQNDFGPAAAPYMSTSYAMTEKLELGLRGFWLPAETVAGEDLAPSDAYVAAITIGTRF